MTREENALKKHLKETFPLTATYKRDPLEFARSYIAEIRTWATKELNVEPYMEK